MLFFGDKSDDGKKSCSGSYTDVELFSLPSGDEGRGMSPLSRYGSHAFIPYPQPPPAHRQKPSNTSRSTSQTPNNVLTINHTASWTYCGPTLDAEASALPRTFHQWVAVTMSDPDSFYDRLVPLLTFLKSFLAEAGVENYWLTIRASRPTHEYDTRRWHVDDDFFEADFGWLIRDEGDAAEQGKARRGWKLAATILGPCTLFSTNNESALHTLCKTKALERTTHQHDCTSIPCLGCSTYTDSVRHSLAESLSNHETSSPGPGEIAFFRLGDSEGAVHSEPKCDVDRVFVNVVPGSEQQLRTLMERWGMEFPRAWCVGLPGSVVLDGEVGAFVKKEEDEEQEVEGEKSG